MVLPSSRFIAGLGRLIGVLTIILGVLLSRPYAEPAFAQQRGAVTGDLREQLTAAPRPGDLFAKQDPPVDGVVVIEAGTRVPQPTPRATEYASSSAESSTNKVYTSAFQLVTTGWIWSGGPSDAVVYQVKAEWDIDANYIEDVQVYVSNSSGYATSNFDVDVTGNDILDGYDQTSDQSHTWSLSGSGRQLNQSWRFNAYDAWDDSATNPDWDEGRIDWIRLTLYYSYQAPDPDLIVVNGSIGVTDTTVDPGQTVTVSWTARNQGGADAGPTRQGVMWSTNSFISTQDTELGNEYLGSMNAGQSDPESNIVSIPSGAVPGNTYYIGVIADYENDEAEGSAGEDNNNDATPVAVTINAPPVTTFGGTVRDAVTGQGISGASVSWGGYSTSTNSSGYYSFSNKPCGTHTLTVSKSGYQTSSQTYTPVCLSSNVKNVDLNPLVTTFGGTVRDAVTGQGISNANVSWGGYSTSTNSSGYYSFSNKPCGTHTLTVSKSGYSTYSSSYTPVCQSSNVKNVNLTPLVTTFGGTVRDAATGQGISGASVSWGGYSTSTNSSGYYSFSNKPCGTRTLTVSKGGYQTYSQTYTPVCLSSNVKNVDLSPEAADVTGTVRDAYTNQPIGGASVSWGGHSATTNSSGVYNLTGLPCETHTLTVSKSGYQTHSETYSPNCYSTNLKNVDLTPVATAFTGTVRDANTNQPIDGASVSWGGYSTTTNASGSYSLTDLPCETHTLTVSKGGYQTYSQPYTPICLSTNLKNVDLTPSEATIAGLVLDEWGQGIGGASVTWGAYSTVTDASGAYNLGVSCESETLEVSKTGFETHQEAYQPICLSTNPKDVTLVYIVAASGTTVITHGWQPGGTVPEWAYELGGAVRDEAGSGRVFRYQGGTAGSAGQLLPCISSECGGGTIGPETVIVFDWAQDSRELGEGFSEAAGEALFALLVEASQRSPALVNLGKLHLIGHSRGTVVNSEAAERLIAAGYSPQQVTSIDPHDWGGFLTATEGADGASPGTAEGGPPDRAGSLSLEDFDVNSEHPDYRCGADNAADPSGVCGWQGVGFNDNYFQEESAGLDGRRVRGASNLDLSTFDGLGITNITHLNIHRWYHCTLDPSATGCDADWFENDPNSCSDLTGSDPNARRSTFADDEEGFYFSRLGGGTGSRCDEHGSRQQVLFNFALREGFVNGDFEKSGTGNDIPGWSFHGGGGSAEAKTLGDNYLELEAGEYRLHNRFFVPTGTSAIGYCWMVDKAGSPEVLRLILTGGSSDDVIGQQDVSGTTGWACSAALVDSSHWGKVRQLKVEVAGPNPSSEVVVGVDNFGLGLGGSCTYSIFPASRDHSAAAIVGQTVSVTAPTGCDWTAQSNASWITVTGGSSGSGGGTVVYDLDANLGGSAREGTITIAGQTFTVTQQGTSCAYSIQPASRTHPAGAASGQTVSVTATAGCGWTASSNAAWITVTGGASGSGNGTVTYALTANTGASQRVGTVTIAGQTFTVTQEGTACSYAIAPTSRTHDSSPVSGQTVSVTAGAGCSWAASSNAGWITVTGGASGSGNGTVTYALTANFGGNPRVGTLTVAGQTFTVTQEGTACGYSIVPTSRSHGPAAASGQTVAVQTGAGCDWTASTNDGWISVTGGASGSGPGTVTYGIEANPATSQRTGSIDIADQTFTVSQAGTTCSYSISPTSRSHGSGALADATVAVSAAPGCDWSATSNDSWLNVTSGSNGSGNGTVRYSITENSSGSTRVGTLDIAGEVFTATQGAPGTAPLLVVDDDDNEPDVRLYYTRALDALGAVYDVWDTGNSDDEPSAAELAEYSAVIWFTGHEYGGSAGPGAAGETALSSFLDGGGCFVLSSQDYLWDRGLTAFMGSHLGVDSGASNVQNDTIAGHGSLFGLEGSAALSYPFDNASDLLIPDGSGETAFMGDAGSAAVSKETAGYRTAYLGFPFEAVPTSAHRRQLMRTILNLCDLDCAGDFNIELADDWVTDERTYQACNSITVGDDYSVVLNTGKVTLEARNEIRLGDGLRVSFGGELEAHVHDSAPLSSLESDLLSDDFDDDDIDPGIWEVGGNIVTEQSGELHIDRTVTDAGGWARTWPVTVDPTSPLTLTRQARVFAANEYFDGDLRFAFEGHPEYDFGVSYANYYYTGNGACVTVGFAIYRNSANSHNCADQQTDVSATISPIWGQWFEERLTYDPVTGDLDYYIDGSLAISYNVGPLPSGATELRLHFGTWGWWTGHYQHMDDLAVRKTSP